MYWLYCYAFRIDYTTNFNADMINSITCLLQGTDQNACADLVASLFPTVVQIFASESGIAVLGLALCLLYATEPQLISDWKFKLFSKPYNDPSQSLPSRRQQSMARSASAVAGSGEKSTVDGYSRGGSADHTLVPSNLNTVHYGYHASRHHQRYAGATTGV